MKIFIIYLINKDTLNKITNLYYETKLKNIIFIDSIFVFFQ